MDIIRYTDTVITPVKVPIRVRAIVYASSSAKQVADGRPDRHPRAIIPKKAST
jgi:hypothetical protein